MGGGVPATRFLQIIEEWLMAEETYEFSTGEHDNPWMSPGAVMAYGVVASGV